MPARTSEATWRGTLKEGSGTMKLGSGRYEGPYTYVSRFESGEGGTNPEELIGAAHAGCFSQFLAARLTNAGFPPDQVHTTATVHLEGGKIHKIELNCEARVPGVDQAKFDELAQESKAGCPVSKALAAVDEIVMNAKLVS